MTLVDLFRHSPAGFGEGDAAIFRHMDIAPLPQNADSAADTGLGVAHFLSDIDGADKACALGENKDGFQIHFAGFLQGHKGHLLFLMDIFI